MLHRCRLPLRIITQTQSEPSNTVQEKQPREVWHCARRRRERAALLFLLEQLNADHRGSERDDAEDRQHLAPVDDQQHLWQLVEYHLAGRERGGVAPAMAVGVQVGRFAKRQAQLERRVARAGDIDDVAHACLVGPVERLENAVDGRGWGDFNDGLDHVLGAQVHHLLRASDASDEGGGDDGAAEEKRVGGKGGHRRLSDAN
mmetsp:Transcript_14584/g.42731  ORF Transcript_14584/g.42731 Transcript_14584/m.42731 type:complete len:202 (+) Transcript_14584:30-635(+)